MKKFFLTLSVISILAVSALAQVTLPANCQSGHINSPVLVCEPPPQYRAEAHGNKTTLDESVLTVIRTFIAEYNPFVYFLN